MIIAILVIVCFLLLAVFMGISVVSTISAEHEILRQRDHDEMRDALDRLNELEVDYIEAIKKLHEDGKNNEK